ncbi:MAG: ABC transporter permease subunit [Sphingobacteriia bacterium]|nr:ABC transporter permease subunit [Sphingobacteriia bacterium]
MLSLLKIEWLKIKKYPAFWWMLGIVLLTYPGINGIFINVYQQFTTRKDAAGSFAKMVLGNPFAFPETWHTVAYFSSFFVLLPAILVIMLITNEYSYRTHRQNIIDGWSRTDFITGKLIDVLIISIVVTIVYIATAIGYGIYADTDNLNRWTEQLHYIPLYFLQTFAQLSIAYLLGYLVKKAFIALGIFLFYYLIVENILVAYLKYKKIPITRFLPFEISDNMLVAPAFAGNFGKDAKSGYEAALALVPQQVALTLVLTALIWFCCYKLHNKRNLS